MRVRHETSWRDIVCRDRPLSPRTLAVLGAAAIAAVVVSSFLPERGAVRAGLAVVLGGLVAFVCLRSPSQGIFVTLGWLAILGGVRRLVTAFQADPKLDPLLLVGPLAIAVLFVTATAGGAFSRGSLLANGMLALGIVAVLWAVHPDQGGIDVGLGGLLFWLAPMLWFWVGRGLVDPVGARRIVLFAAGVAAVAGIYGLGQGVIGFPSWDWDWIFNRGRFNSLYVGPGTYRPLRDLRGRERVRADDGLRPLIFTGLLVTRLEWSESVRSGLAVGRSASAAVTGPRAGPAAQFTLRWCGLVLALPVVAIVRLRRAGCPSRLAATWSPWRSG